jgi:hypothetical protein
MRMRNLAMNTALVVAIVALVNGVAVRDAKACSCLPPTVESSYNQSSDVVSAEILRQFVLGNTRYYVARVLRTFKGCQSPGNTLLLSTPTSSATCGALLNARRHLINADTAGSVFGLPALSINSCGYNLALSALTQHDREFLEGRTVCCGDKCSCADGSSPVLCFADPCSVAPTCPDASCVANYCGGCNAEFYDANGYAVCQAGNAFTSDAD